MDLFDLLANPEKQKQVKHDVIANTIDDEIIRLLNIKCNDIGIQNIIDKTKFEKIINYIKLFK
jgi:hypothetical protein